MDTDQTPPDGTTPDGGENWEQRFKGLQRSYQALQKEMEQERSRLNAQVEQIKSQLEGARANNANLNTRISELETERNRAATQHEQALSELQSQLTQAQEQSQAFQSQVEEANGKLQAQEADLRVRKMLTDPKYAALAPLYEAGLMGDLTSLEGDELTAKLDKASEVVKDQKLGNFVQQLDGTTPPPPSGDTGPPAKANTDEMAAWLMDPANARSPEFDSVQQRYLEAVAKEQSN